MRLGKVIALVAVLLLGVHGSALANEWPGPEVGAALLFSLAEGLLLPRRRRAIAVAVLVLLVARTSSAIVCTFQSTGGSGNVYWSNAGRWDQSGSGGNTACPPGPNDSAVFNAGVRVQLVDANVNVGSVTLTSGFAGGLYLSPGKTLTVVGDWNQDGGIFGQEYGTLIYTPTLGRINIGGDFILSGGTFSASSTLMNVAGAFTETGTSTFMHNGGTVMLSSPTTQTFASNGATFKNLTIDDADLITGDGLVGYWKLDESSGTTFADSSSSGNSGTLHNSQTWVTPASASSLPGLSFTDPAGLSFDGSSNYGTMGITNLPALNASMTIALWVYYSSIDSSNRNAFALKSGSSSVQIGQRGSALVASKSGGVILATASSTPASGWHHLAYTFNGTTHRLYLDGGTATTSTVAPDTGAASSVWIGTYNGGSELWAGSLDDVRIYNRVLGATEIAALAAGNQIGTSLATQTLTGNPTVLGDLMITRGTLAAGNTAITVGNNWSNSGGAFTTGTTGSVTFNGSASGNSILAGGSDFNSLTVSGTGSWTMTDPASVGVKVDKNLTLSSGTLTATAGTLNVGGALAMSGGTFTHNGGTVMLSSPTSQTFASNGATFKNLVINDGLVGYWKLDETSGTTIADSSGYGNDGTLNGPTRVTGASLPGLGFTDAAGVAFSGSSQYATLGTTSLPNINGAMTIAFWLYYASVDNSNRNAVVLASGASLVQVGFRGSALVASKSAGTILVTANSTPASGWHHIAYTFNGTATHRLYVDGASPGLATATPDTGVTTAAWLGTYDGIHEFLVGKLDDVRIYNRALGPNEISGLAAGNQTGTASATQTLTGSPIIAGDLTIASGKLAAGTASLSLSGSWLNYGGLFTAGSAGLLTLNGSASTNVILSAGQRFGGVTVNGTGTWTLADRMEVDPASTLTATAGTLALSNNTLRAGNLTGGAALSPGTGKVVLDGNASATMNQGTFTDLRVEPVSATNLVGYWKLDAGQGSTALDFSSGAHAGTLTGGAGWTDSGLPTAISFDNPAAATFDGTSDYIDAGAAATPSNAAYSVCAWVNLASTTGSQAVVSIDGTNVSGLALMKRSDTGKFSLTTLITDTTGTTEKYAAGTTTPSAGTWYHLCGTYDAANLRLYVNGLLEGTTANAAAWNATGHTIIGAGRSSALRTNFVSGAIDDVRIYNVTLTAAQIAALAAGRYPAGLSGVPTYTLGANVTVSGNFGLDSGTLATSSYTLGATSTGATSAAVNSGTYAVGSAASTFSGGLTVRSSGTLDLSTSGGAVKIGSGKALIVDGTLSASSTGATIQNAGVAATYYSFQVGSTATATPTLNITGLAVKNTDTNGMYINAVAGSTTTFTRFDGVAFSGGTGTRLLQIYAPTLYLVSNGCTFDTGVASGTTTSNVTLRGDGSATETRAVFGNATCATNKTPCEGSDDDDDAAADGVGDTTATNAAVVQWVHSALSDTSGTIEGFPAPAFDWNTFTYYSTYVAYHNVGGGTTDRIYLRDTNGNPKTATSYWDAPGGETIVGTPRYDTVSSVHYLYVATGAGKVYRLIDDTTAKTLTPDGTGSWAGANNPFNCSCTITTPLTEDTGNLYWGGTVLGVNKVWTLGKTSAALASSSPLSVTAVISGAAPTAWTSGNSYIFMGSAAHFYKVDATHQTLTTDNTSPTGNVNGRLSLINSKLYGADNRGSLWVLDPANFGTTLWSYHDDANHNGCLSGDTCAVQSSIYVDPTLNRAFYGDSDGHLYASYNSSGTTGAQSTGFPYHPNASSEIYASAPLYSAGILVAGTTTGNVYVIDVNGGSGPVLKQTYKLGATTRISGVGYNSSSSSYMIAAADPTSKDGKLIYIDAMTDPTPASN